MKSVRHRFTLKQGKSARDAEILLNHFDIKCRRRGLILKMLIDRKELPNLAEKVSKIQLKEIGEIILNSDTRMSRVEYNQQLEILLNIRGSKWERKQNT